MKANCAALLIRMPVSLKERLTEAAKRLTRQTPGGYFSINSVVCAALEVWVQEIEVNLPANPDGSQAEKEGGYPK